MISYIYPTTKLAFNIFTNEYFEQMPNGVFFLFLEPLLKYLKHQI